ncbi:MAG: hypothetical protein RMN25_00755 [Anaerolineae bacterium]|nr:hypothetical protein [Thermoflexales bacterium]MDW8406285.1 hypothetical protein [Anaerolineae bacterium]
MDLREEVLAETENYSIVQFRDPAGETIYDLNMDQITIHLLKEDLDELIELIGQLKKR